MKTILLGCAAFALAWPATAQEAAPPTTAEPREATDLPAQDTPERPAAPPPASEAAAPPTTAEPREAADLPARDTPGRPAAAPPAAAPPADAPRAAQTQSSPQPSSNAMVNLIRALVAQGTLTAANGQALLEQAEAEAAVARAATPPPGTVRVPYVPESVRAQIRDELRADVLQAAREQGWATPGQVVEWTRGITITGDFRFRDQFDLFEGGNANNIIDFATLNAIGPVDLNPTTNPGGFPFLNTRQDRNNRLSIRARLGVLAQVTPGVEVGVRLASGGTDGPVSTTQLLGAGFGKKDIWLDQAYVRLRPIAAASLTLGRMANPFYSSDVLWDVDLNFDGVSLAGDSGDAFGDVRLSGVAGVFPYEYSDPGFPSFQQDKRGELNKWLYGGQVVADWAIRDGMSLRAGVAYYDFDGVQGRPSEPCQLFGGGLECSTDPLAPAFLSKGNTLFTLRNIIADPGNTNPAAPQFAGLTFDYDILNVTADFSLRLNERLHLTVGGDFVRNLAFDRGDICKVFPGFAGRAADPVTGAPAIPSTPDTVRPPFQINPVIDPATGQEAVDVNGVPINPCADLATVVGPGTEFPYEGGDTAWMVRATVGFLDPKRFGEWNLFVGYKYIESDSMLDALTDSEFHLGGTNTEGYVIAGTLGLFDNVTARGRWFSANEIDGPPLSIDVLQLDLLVAF